MTEAVDVQELMRQVSEAYKHFASYQDTGYVESIHSPGTADESHSRLTFSTLFQRPNLFRFEWRDRQNEESPWETSTIWCDGKTAYSKCPWNKKVTSGKELSRVVAGATGISRGTAQITSALLMSEIDGRRLTEQGAFEHVGLELLGGEQCHRLRNEAPHETDLWISTTRCIILKIFEQYIVGDGPDASDWLRSRRFKSFAGFFHWLKFRNKLAWSKEAEPFHVIEQTYYTNVILNAQVPEEAFTLAGTK